MDKLALANLVIGGISAAAATAAVYYTRKSPTKIDLERVERNTAESAASIDEVRQHIERVEHHLSDQEIRSALAELSSTISINVSGECVADDQMILKFQLVDASHRLSSIDLLNARGMIFENCECGVISKCNFQATIGTQALRRWFYGGEMLQGPNFREVTIRANIGTDYGDVTRKFVALASQVSKPFTNPNGSQYFKQFTRIDGKC